MIGLWLVACALLGPLHATQRGHWTDRQGQSHHTVRSGCTGGGHTADVHAASQSADHDACELATARHAFASAEVARPPSLTRPEGVQVVDSYAPVASDARALYRFAPKTSPPAI